jgi:hypothetical protein
VENDACAVIFKTQADWSAPNKALIAIWFLDRIRLEANLKIRSFVREQGEAEDQPAGILAYGEDLRRGLNACTCPLSRIQSVFGGSGEKTFYRIVK